MMMGVADPNRDREGAAKPNPSRDRDRDGAVDSAQNGSLPYARGSDGGVKRPLLFSPLPPDNRQQRFLRCVRLAAWRCVHRRRCSGWVTRRPDNVLAIPVGTVRCRAANPGNRGY